MVLCRRYHSFASSVWFQQKITGKKIHKRLREMVEQPEDQFDEQGYYISFDPLRVGNCPFVVS